MDKPTLIVLIATLIGTAGGVVGLIYGFMRNLKTDINIHVDRIKDNVDRMEGKIDKLAKDMKEENRMMEQRITESNRRMDGVYHILLKRTENLK
jgi:hypothetical protein